MRGCPALLQKVEPVQSSTPPHVSVLCSMASTYWVVGKRLCGGAVADVGPEVGEVVEVEEEELEVAKAVAVHWDVGEHFYRDQDLIPSPGDADFDRALKEAAQDIHQNMEEERAEGLDLEKCKSMEVYMAAGLHEKQVSLLDTRC